MPGPILEVALSTLDDARAARDGGADRIELCAALELDGLTPSLGTLIEVRREVPLPVVFMLRPRAGDFVYSDAEFLTMRRDAELALSNGAGAIVFGCLAADRTVDVERTRAMVRQAGPGRAVFHRAFDRTPDLGAALDVLIALGVTRVLTSGGRPTAIEGAEVIRGLIGRAAGRIEVLPGGGVTPANAADLLARTGATQVHGSFSVAASKGWGFRRTCGVKVGAVRAALRG